MLVSEWRWSKSIGEDAVMPEAAGDPLRARHGLTGRMNHGGFRTIQLNVVGWSALLGTGSAVGSLISLPTRLPLVGGILAGVAGTWAGLLAWDERRWRNSTVAVSRGELAKDDYKTAVEALRSQGVAATYRALVDEETGETYGAIECRQADLDAVERLLDQMAPGPREP